MGTLADRISDELRVLVGQPISDGWRVANMQIFEFGPLRKRINRKGEEVESGELKLHIQCRWRMVDRTRILFARDDLLRPADESISLDDFDWDKQESKLDVVNRAWFAEHHTKPLCVISASGDDYGGFRLALEENVALEVFPCDSNRGEYSEHWRLLGHRKDGSHFVIDGNGVLGEK